MNKTLLALALLLATSANASEIDPNFFNKPNQTIVGGLAFAGASANSTSQSTSSASASIGNTNATGGASNATALGGSSKNNVSIDNNTRMPASTAASPSVGTANDCQIATPSSKALSILILSVSGTTGVTYNDLCFAYKMGQFDIAEKLMCEKSQAYAKANPKCK